MLQRHTINQKGLIYGYDVFYLLGYGRNNNLLGSALSQYNLSVLYDEKQNNSFYGLGFGFEKQFLPHQLKEFQQRLGRLMLRLSEGNTSYDLSFKNDLRIGGLFYGDATDYGDTGSLYVNYTKAIDPVNIHQLGFVIQLFTAKPDYNKIANNTINSHDGRKNVWHTTGVYKNTFFANAYLKYKRQTHHIVYQLNTGIESNKLGAEIQNRLHDSFGLNPRYPWNVSNKKGWYIEGSSQLYLNSL